MSARRLAFALALVCAACKPAPTKPAARAPVPTVRATVITLRTTIEPDKRSIVHTIVIQGSRARNMAENITWRVFDTKAKTVTLVDDIERTARTEPLAAIARRKHEAMTGVLPRHFPDLRFERTDETRAILGLTARKSIIESGGYRRELWVAEHRGVPSDLFAMMQTAEIPSSPLAPMMRKVEDSLQTLRGFPLVDHSEVAYGNKKMVIDRVVLSIAERDVPQAAITIPAGYRVTSVPTR